MYLFFFLVVVCCFCCFHETNRKIKVDLLAAGVPVRKGGVCIASLGLLSLKLA
jgi:hypothetical protein